MTAPLRHFDLFSGIGGFGAAAVIAEGYETVGFCEIDPWARQVLTRLWPDIPIHHDVKELDYDTIGPVDILTGGPPCGPASQAGKRQGTGDDRWLWPEAVEAVRRIRPTWVCYENPAGITTLGEPVGEFQVDGVTIARGPEADLYEKISSRQEEVLLARICQELDDAGYDVVISGIPASALDAFHIRERYWILGHARVVAGDDGQACIPAKADRPEYEAEGTASGQTGADDAAGEFSALPADTACVDGERSRHTGTRGRAKPADGGEGVPANAAGARRQRARPAGEAISQPAMQQQSSRCGCRACTGSGRTARGPVGTAQRGLGRMVHGLPDGLDGYPCWFDYPVDTPPTVNGQRDRGARLTGLGNSIVPQVGAEILAAIRAAHVKVRQPDANEAKYA